MLGYYGIVVWCARLILDALLQISHKFRPTTVKSLFEKTAVSKEKA